LKARRIAPKGKAPGEKEERRRAPGRLPNHASRSEETEKSRRGEGANRVRERQRADRGKVGSSIAAKEVDGNASDRKGNNALTDGERDYERS